jgi:hypothetical protein
MASKGPGKRAFCLVDRPSSFRGLIASPIANEISDSFGQSDACVGGPFASRSRSIHASDRRIHASDRRIHAIDRSIHPDDGGRHVAMSEADHDRQPKDGDDEQGNDEGRGVHLIYRPRFRCAVRPSLISCRIASGRVISSRHASSCASSRVCRRTPTSVPLPVAGGPRFFFCVITV